MKTIRKLFFDSVEELGNMRTLSAAAMLLAITVVLGFYRLQITDYIRIGFDFLVKEFAAFLFGPVAAAIVAGLADIISYILKPVGAFFPGLTISAMLAAVIYGVVLYKKPLSLKRIIVANTLVTVFINMLLNTYWMTILLGNGFWAILPARAVKQLIMLPIEIVLFYAVSKVLMKAGIMEHIGRSVQK